MADQKGELRLPLQVGTSSLAGFARASASLVPGLLLIFAIVLPALLAPWDDAVEIYPHLIVPYVFAVFGGIALLAYGRKHLALALRERPSDILFGRDAMRVEGGRLSGLTIPFAEIETVRLVGRHEKLEMIEEEGKSKKENFWRLLVELKDGSTRQLGSAEDPRERDSLQALCDTLRESIRRSDRTQAARPEPPVPLKCTGCGAPAVPADAESIKCPYCGTPIHIPDDVRHRIRAMKSRDAAMAKSQKLITKLVNQPGALRTSFFVMFAAVPSLLAWPAAIGFGMFLYALCYLRVADVFLLSLAAFGVIAALYYLVRGQLTDRQALRLLTLGFAARAPSAAGGAHHCRQCNGPLVEPPGQMLVRCAYCGAENVLGLDPRGDARKSTDEVASLDEALFRRSVERTRWRYSALAAIAMLLVVAILVRVTAKAPNPLKAIGDARDLKRITYDPFNEFQPKVSPDGTKILYDLRVPGEDSDESIMTAPSTGAFRGTEMTMEKVHAIRPQWTNDGKGFVYVSSTQRDVLRRVDSLQPYAASRDLYSFGYDIDVASMSPDNVHFTFAGAERKQDGWYVYVGQLDGTPDKQVTSGINPAWSPDGAHIAYSRTVSSYRQLMVMTLDASNKLVTTQQLTNEPCDHEDPVYSPDGAYLAYVGNCGSNARGKKNVWNLYAMQSDGTQNEQLTDGLADVETPTWSADFVYFSANVAGNYDIWRVRLAGPLAGHNKRPALGALAAPAPSASSAPSASASNVPPAPRPTTWKILPASPRR